MEKLIPGNRSYKKVEILTQIVNTIPYFTEYVLETKEVMKNKAYTLTEKKM